MHFVRHVARRIGGCRVHDLCHAARGSVRHAPAQGSHQGWTWLSLGRAGGRDVCSRGRRCETRGARRSGGRAHPHDACRARRHSKPAALHGAQRCNARRPRRRVQVARGGYETAGSPGFTPLLRGSRKDELPRQVPRRHGARRAAIPAPHRRRSGRRSIFIPAAVKRGEPFFGTAVARQHAPQGDDDHRLAAGDHGSVRRGALPGAGAGAALRLQPVAQHAQV